MTATKIGLGPRSNKQKMVPHHHTLHPHPPFRFTDINYPPPFSLLLSQKPTIDLVKVSKWTSIICGVALIVVGVLGFMGALTSFNFTVLVNSFYVTLFGFMTVATEFGRHEVLTRMSFLCSYSGRGIFYFFIGSLGAAAGAAALGMMIVGIIMMVNGVFNIFLGTCFSSTKSTNPSTGEQLKPASNNIPQSKQEQ
eukprot:TRINITY_DN2203_c0_g1_i3.p1 TRINITY_DN2203_c0_g1~~TRINITY_DN2203_c0_g1_i3.p1  ORF type:complete len:195 (-),score=39.34 TRINITY_DN2203_c0_g1_i3:146-730(-)